MEITYEVAESSSLSQTSMTTVKASTPHLAEEVIIMVEGDIVRHNAGA